MVPSFGPALLYSPIGSRVVATIAGVAISTCIFGCVCQNSSMPLTDACSGLTQRVPLTFSQWNNELDVTACGLSDADLEYLPDYGDSAGSFLLKTRGGGNANVIFVFELAGAVRASPDNVVRYVKESEYGAIADPRSGIRAELLELIDMNGRRGAIVRWHEPTDGESARDFNHAYGAFLSHEVVVFLAIETLTSADLDETLGQVLSIKAQRRSR